MQLLHCMAALLRKAQQWKEDSNICNELSYHPCRVHSDPCSDLIFMKEAAYTACYTGQIRCWLRPTRPAEKSKSVTSG